MTPLPDGFDLELDRSVQRFSDGTVLAGGHPGRLITLTPGGAAALDALLDRRPSPPGTRALGARLVDAGMAHPRPTTRSPVAAIPTSTIVVPARDRTDDLERCLQSLSEGPEVVVVDDASVDPIAVADVCARHGARLITRALNGGPGQARNDAVAAIDTDLVVFVDSDCSVTSGWLAPLLGLFEDPGIAAVAPRIRPRRTSAGPRSSSVARYSDARSALDLGDRPSEVGPDRLVRYVPTAALAVRRSALVAGFDPELRTGEDVDLVWRLIDDGWRVRYEPSVTVSHREPSSWRALLGRRFRYGTSAGPLHRRHPGRLSPVDLQPWPTAVALGVLGGRPRLAFAALVASTASLQRSVAGRGIPLGRVLGWSAGGAGWTLVGVARMATQLATPAVVAGLVSRRFRATSALLLAAPPLVEWWRRRPPMDPLRWMVASVADDAAYGAGVWAGCMRARTLGPLTPSFHRSSVPGPVRADNDGKRLT